MKLYGAPAPAPNPRRVRIFLAEKGVDLPETFVDMRKREHKSPEYREKNSLGQIPTLELDDGTTISETVSICRYFEALHPEPALFGRSAVERALVDMWTRRVELQIMIPVGMFWRHAHPYTASLLTQFKDFGESNRETVKTALGWLDRELDGRDFIGGDTYTMTDICALTTIDFAHWIGLETPAELTRVHDWHKRVSDRPSAAA
jgi:glutathione S-transferase